MFLVHQVCSGNAHVGLDLKFDIYMELFSYGAIFWEARIKLESGSETLIAICFVMKCLYLVLCKTYVLQTIVMTYR